MSELERMLTAIRFYEIARQESKRLILCEPHRVHQIRAAVDQAGAADIIAVQPSPVCPAGKLLVIDQGAVEAGWNEWVQELAKKPIRFRSYSTD